MKCPTCSTELNCPECGSTLENWLVRHTTVQSYNLDGTLRSDPVTVAIRKLEKPSKQDREEMNAILDEMTQAEIEARGLD